MGRKEDIRWEIDLGGIDERKGRTGFGGGKPSAGLVYVYVDVDERMAEISIDLVTGNLAQSSSTGK